MAKYIFYNTVSALESSKIGRSIIEKAIPFINSKLILIDFCKFLIAGLDPPLLCTCLFDKRPTSSWCLLNLSVQIKVCLNATFTKGNILGQKEKTTQEPILGNMWHGFAVTPIFHQLGLHRMVMSSYIALPAKLRIPAEI